jgi:hypothetical protein
VGLSVKFEDTEEVKKFIEETESGMYKGVNADKEVVWVMLEQGVGMDVHTNQSNGHVRIDDYNKNGLKVSETFNGRWDK